MLAGYYGGILDELFLGILDFFMSIPELLLMVLLGSMLGPSLRNIILSIVLVAWVVPAKLVRSEILKQKQRSEEHTSELQSRQYLVCRLLLEKKNKYLSLQTTQCKLITN